MTAALILMGGKGARFGSPVPKQFHNIFGKQIYLHTLDRFAESGLFDAILLVCHPLWMERVERDLKEYPHPVRLVAGGKTRQESSFLGLKACPAFTEYVLIHDAVRPFVSEEILRNNVEGVKKHLATDTCIPSTDTLVFSSDLKKISSIPDRSLYLRGQTPQSFSYPLILEAHQKSKREAATDDCTLVMDLGKEIYLIAGDESNMKITTEMDLSLAEQLFFRWKTKRRHPCASLKGKTIALAGGTGGIGEAIKERLLLEGARPLILSRRSAPYGADLSSYAQAKSLFERIAREEGPLDALVNCFGLFHLKALEDCSFQEISAIIDVNLKGVIYACKLARIKPGGHIINFASSSYSRGRKGYCIYSATKAGVVNFTQGLSEERPELLINAVAPQRTDTSMRQEFFPEEDPLDRLSPDAVAQEIIALLKETKVTGSVIDIRKNSPTH